MHSSKRSIKEALKFEQLEKPIAKASVHGAMLSVSKVKKGRSSVYFDGMLTDGMTQVRVVGLRPEQQKKLQSFEEA